MPITPEPPCSDPSHCASAVRTGMTVLPRCAVAVKLAGRAWDHGGMRWARGRTRAWWCLAGILVLAWLPVVRASASDDPFFDTQWGLAQVHAPDAWPVDTGAGVTI